MANRFIFYFELLLNSSGQIKFSQTTSESGLCITLCLRDTLGSGHTFTSYWPITIRSISMYVHARVFRAWPTLLSLNPSHGWLHDRAHYDNTEQSCYKFTELLWCLIWQHTIWLQYHSMNNSRHNHVDDISIYHSVWTIIICAQGPHSKSICTKNRWFTLVEFVKQALTPTDGHWKKDILCHGLVKVMICYITESYSSCHF